MIGNIPEHHSLGRKLIKSMKNTQKTFFGWKLGDIIIMLIGHNNHGKLIGNMPEHHSLGRKLIKSMKNTQKHFLDGNWETPQSCLLGIINMANL